MAKLAGRYLHFTLGPVQGFVAQARRTRDLWAGSFLLSFLAGQAMAAILRAGGTIVFPQVASGTEPTDPLLKAIVNGGEGPSVGSLPNRFKAEIPGDFAPDLCREAIKVAWDKVAEAVWDQFVTRAVEFGHDYGESTKVIWRRQVEHFWEIAWCIGEKEDLLDRRKNWRTSVPPVEAGDKCTMMSGWQEVSGFVRAREKTKQDAFWAKIRSQKGVTKLNLRPDERLCAISLIKRLFPLADKAVGWPVRTNFPSTAYVAAVPWIAGVLANPDKSSEAIDFGRTAKEICGQSSLMQVDRFPSLRRAVGGDSQKKTFAALGGEYFHRATLEDEKDWEEDTKATRETLGKMLDPKHLGEPTPFYGLLLMDGDRLGKLLQNQKYDASAISQALGRFTARVEEVAQNNDGVRVYAGGDDVLGLFPLETAIKAAAELQRTYGAAFCGSAAAEEATISAAIVFAHFHQPLQGVLAKAHDLLDEVAKEKTGRSSLAVTVWKGAGQTLTWAMPWECLLAGENAGSISTHLDELVAAFRGDEAKVGQYSSRFFYHIRERFSLFKEGGLGDPVALLAAEYLKNRESRETNINEAKERVEKLLRVCRQAKRDQTTVRVQCDVGPITADGALLVRFLAAEGKEA